MKLSSINKKIIRCLILEDDYYPACELEKFISRRGNGYMIIGRFECSSQLKEHFEKGGKADLIISDVSLADGNVMEVFEKYHISTPVIFVSAQDKDAESGTRFNMVGFITKPVTEESISECINHFEANYIV